MSLAAIAALTVKVAFQKATALAAAAALLNAALAVHLDNADCMARAVCRLRWLLGCWYRMRPCFACYHKYIPFDICFVGLNFISSDKAGATTMHLGSVKCINASG
jgi:hypothetical protein